MKRFLRFVGIRVAVALVGVLPLRLAQALGGWFGAAAHALARGERRKALESLAVAFPERTEAEREEIARRCFRHLGQAAFEAVCIAQIDPRLDELISWDAGERAALTAALARGRGVVFVSGHVGQWELLARRVAMSGIPCYVIAKETSDPRLTELVTRFRARGQVRSIWRGRDGAAKQMLKALRSGAVLGLLIDQDTKVQSVFAPFFGKLAATPRAAADLALRTGAALFVGFCQRDGDAFRLSMREISPVGVQEDPAAEAEGNERAVHALTARLNAEIEQAIRRAPEQWVWMHRRWRTQP